MSLLGAILVISIILTTVSTCSINKKIPKAEPLSAQFSSITNEIICCLIIEGDLTSAEVAQKTGFEKRMVDSVFTAYLQRRGYGIRIKTENNQTLLHLDPIFIKKYSLL